VNAYELVTGAGVEHLSDPRTGLADPDADRLHDVARRTGETVEAVRESLAKPTHALCGPELLEIASAGPHWRHPGRCAECFQRPGERAFEEARR
jgi:hypothetical protein